MTFACCSLETGAQREAAQREIAVVTELLCPDGSSVCQDHTLVVLDSLSGGRARSFCFPHPMFNETHLNHGAVHISGDLAADFCAKVDEPHPVWAQLTSSLPARLIGGDEVSEIFSVPNGWDRFNERFPHASEEIIKLSRVGFNATGDIAMVYLDMSGHGYGRADIYVFRMDHGKWREIGEIGPFWIR